MKWMDCLQTYLPICQNLTSSPINQAEPKGNFLEDCIRETLLPPDALLYNPCCRGIGWSMWAKPDPLILTKGPKRRNLPAETSKVGILHPSPIKKVGMLHPSPIKKVGMLHPSPIKKRRQSFIPRRSEKSECFIPRRSKKCIIHPLPIILICLESLQATLYVFCLSVLSI